MDRLLIAGAVLLLILEVSFLMTDLDRSSTSMHSQSASAVPIGTLVKKTNLVHRRGSNTLIWDDSNPADVLYEYDSILTLANSSAALKLNGDTALEIDQDTLIVLEPASAAGDGRLRIRFARGSMRAKNAGPLSISDDKMFQLSADAGSSLAVAELDDGRIQVQMENGTGTLKLGTKAEEIPAGQMLLLRDGIVEERKSASSKIKWDANVVKRIYSNRFPADANVAWDGDASRLQIMTPAHALETKQLKAGAPLKSISLREGVSQVWLEENAEFSERISIEAKRPPLIRHLTPSSNDRIKSGSEIAFAWESAPLITHYRLQVSRNEHFSEIFREVEANGPRAEIRFDDVGRFFWRVKPFDDLGIELPVTQTSAFDVVSPTLEAPKLNPPEIREPAEEKSEPVHGASLWYRLLVPEARAESKQSEAVFSWQETNGAEHYIIEISATADFDAPLVHEKVNGTKYIWRGTKGRKYFWRVAAGNSQTLGPFSAAEVVSFNRVVPVARKAETAPPQTAPNPPKVSETVLPPQPIASVQPEEKKPQESFGERMHRQSGRFIYRPYYRKSKSANAKEIVGTFSGVIPTSVAGEVYFNEGEHGRFELFGSFEQTSWKPIAKTTQPSVTEQRVELNLAFRPTASSWSYALALETLPLLVRTAPEQARLETQSLFGASAKYAREWGGGEAEFKLDLRMSGALYGARAGAVYSMPFGDTIHYTVGPGFGYESFQGSGGRSLQSTMIGFYFGMGW